MAATMLFSRQREKTMVMRTRFLLDIYMREGDAHMRKRQYKMALESYDSVLQLDSSNMAALVGKSQCHVRLGHVKQALADVEKALAIDNINPPAVLQKADIFYCLNNYEMALLFYHRGHKVSPEITAFQDGISNCQRCITNIKKGKGMKLTEAGDLTIYVHKKMRKMTKAGDNRDKRQRTPPPRIHSRQTSSAGGKRQKKEVNPLVRLSRKQPIKLQLTTKRANQNKHCTPVSRASGRTVYSEPDEKTMKEILGELYGDRIYLQNFIKETDEKESRLDMEVTNIAENGLQFLLNRVTYWNHRRLPPHPTPSPPLSQKRSRQGSSQQRNWTESPLPRQKSSLWEREVSDLIRLLNNDNLREESLEDEVIVGYRPYKKEKKKVKKLHFEFASYRPDSDMGERGRGGTATDRQIEKQQTKMTDIKEDEEYEDEDYILNYLVKELIEIENAFDNEDFEQCRRMAVTCLQTVYNYSEDDIADKLDLIAKIHSILGNVLLEHGEYEGAQEHHEKDLEIGEKCKLDEAVSRALGNLGRVFVQRKHIHKALGAFARKTKLVDRPIETAWLFHEIGDCFLTLNQYGYARDAGRKSLQAAEEAQHRMYQLQACVLIGVAQVKLRDYDDSYVEFERALDLARIEGDRDSEEMITRALDEVNGRISEQMKSTGPTTQRKPSGEQTIPEVEEQTISRTADDRDETSRKEVPESPDGTKQNEELSNGSDGPKTTIEENGNECKVENTAPATDITSNKSNSPSDGDSYGSGDDDDDDDDDDDGNDEEEEEKEKEDDQNENNGRNSAESNRGKREDVTSHRSPVNDSTHNVEAYAHRDHNSQ